MAHKDIRGDTLNPITDSHKKAIPYTNATSNPGYVNDAYAVRETPTTASSGLSASERLHRTPKAKEPLSRSTSTPLMQGSEMSDSDIDKKRNKLGYQRISIACAHCRRRKIRCLVDDNDPQQRCQNCIRLKKECLFYPVEQQSAMEERSQASSKAGQSSTVSSSPAEIGSGRPFDEREGHLEFPMLPSNAPNNYSGMPLGTMSAHDQGSFPGSVYDYPQRSESRSPWPAPGEFDPHAQPAQPPPTAYSHQQYWHPNQGASTGDYSPFPIEHIQHRPEQHASPLNYAPQEAYPAWQQPVRASPYENMTRSMSNIESAHAGDYRSSSLKHAVSPHQMQHSPMIEQGETYYYAPVSHPSQTFLESPHQYTNSVAANHLASDHWYHHDPSFDPVHGGIPEPASEDATKYQRR